MSFYLYRQNNSGGSFITDDKLCQWVVVEAESAEISKKYAKKLGIYFNGIKKGKDCACCGDRWWDQAQIIENEIERIQDLCDNYGGWTTPDARIFYANGKVIELNKRGNK